MKKLVWSVLLLAIFSSVSMAFPGPMGAKKHRPMPEPSVVAVFQNLDRLQDELNLTNKQVDEIHRINKKYDIKGLSHSEVLVAARVKVKRLSMEDDVNFAEIRKTLENSSKALVDMRMDQIHHKVAVRDVLNPKQRAKLKQILERGRHKR